MNQRGERSLGGLSVFAPEALPGARLLQFRGGQRFHSYYNDMYTVVAVFRSKAEVAYRGKKYRAEGGEVGLLAPDGIFRHVTNPIPEVVGKLQIEPELVDRAAREFGIRNAQVQFPGLLMRMPQLFDALSALHGCIADDPTPLELQTLFSNCLWLFIAQRSGGPPRLRIGLEPNALRKAREMLHARFADKITLDQLAEYAGVSVRHLLNIFTREVGLSPHAYQIHLRLAEARRLLARGAPLSTVAVDVGFTDQSHLARHFRRTLGVTPGAYHQAKTAIGA
jgi:AraC-like DNA-binding protein